MERRPGGNSITNLNEWVKKALLRGRFFMVFSGPQMTCGVVNFIREKVNISAISLSLTLKSVSFLTPDEILSIPISKKSLRNWLLDNRSPGDVKFPRILKLDQNSVKKPFYLVIHLVFFAISWRHI